MMNGSGDPERRALAELFRAQDKLLAEARADAEHAALTRRADPSTGLVYRDAPEPEVDVDALNAERAADWDRWVQGHISNARRELVDALQEDVCDLAASLQERWKHDIEHAAGILENENRSLKALLAEALGKLADVRQTAEDEAREQRAAIAELQRKELVRTTRDLTLVERGARVAELQRQNAESRVALADQQLSRAFDQRDARIALLEQQLQMLLRHMGLMGFDPPRL
jgi:hypothetical protein